MHAVLEFVCLLLSIYVLVLLVRIVLGIIPSLPEPLRPVERGLGALTDPLLNPLRRVIPPVGAGGLGLDLSPLVLFFGIMVLQLILCG